MKEAFLNYLKNPPRKYRPIPFWSWNEKLNIDETRYQIDEMDKAGIGGYFMHARGGLQTQYMGQEWLDNIAAGIDEAGKRDMGAWAYDENGWPSGFGDGKVNGRGETYQQKYLRYEFTDNEVVRDDGRTIFNAKLDDGRNMHFYYEVNPFYVDTLDEKVTRAFIEEIYEPYYELFKDDIGKAMPGFFTDEPQVSRKGIPWSLTLPEQYLKAYNENLLPLLPHLFLEGQGYKKTRFRFWHLVQELFVTNFTKQIYDWCNERGISLTGHMVLEETLLSQITSNGAVMPHYEFFHMPGMDWLGRYINPPTIPLQVASVSHQLGKKQILSETFGLTGWNASFEDLKWLYEWQMVRGITQLCQHLQGYSLRGIRKRDYPPSLFYQQPWWDKYKVFNDTVSRIGMLLSEGEVDFRVLVIHPQSSAWLHFNNSDNTIIEKLHNQFLSLTAILESSHIPFHYGDERILSRYGHVQDNMLRVGLQTYDLVIVPPLDNLTSSSVALLKEYVNNCGKIIWVGHKPSLIDGEESDMLVELVDHGTYAASPEDVLSVIPDDTRTISVKKSDGLEISAITATWRNMHKETTGVPFRFYYFVNSDTENNYQATIRIPGYACWLFDQMSGVVKNIPYTVENGYVIVKYNFEQMASLTLFVSDDADTFNISCENDEYEDYTYAGYKPLDSAMIEGEWELSLSDPNVLRLDYCDIWFDDKLQAEHEHVSVVQARACQLERPVNIKMRYEILVANDYTPDGELYLVIEKPELFKIRVNNHNVSNNPCGYYRDKSFKKVDISGCLHAGINELWLETEFKQAQAVYDNLRRAKVFEAEKNKLTYDSEIEAVYIIGNFSISTPGNFTKLPRNAMRYNGDFILDRPLSFVKIENLTSQGLPFYCGKVKLSKTINLQECEVKNRVFRLLEKMATVVGLKVNGRKVSEFYWRPYEASLDGFLKPGENILELELTGNLRNMLGPHHLEEGESYMVAPRSFFKEPNVWGTSQWNEDYCFMPFGIII